MNFDFIANFRLIFNSLPFCNYDYLIIIFQKKYIYIYYLKNFLAALPLKKKIVFIIYNFLFRIKIIMFRDTQWINITSKIKIKKSTDPPTSDTSSTSSDRTCRSDTDEMTINSEIYDPLPPSDSKELRNIEGGEYFLPSADKNIERLQMQHFLIRC